MASPRWVFNAAISWKLFKSLPRAEQAKFVAWVIGKAFNMGKIREWLNGKKTYLVAGAAVIGAVIAWATGAVDLVEAIKVILGAVLGTTIRAGVAKAA